MACVAFYTLCESYNADVCTKNNKSRTKVYLYINVNNCHPQRFAWSFSPLCERNLLLFLLSRREKRKTSSRYRSFQTSHYTLKTNVSCVRSEKIVSPTWYVKRRVMFNVCATKESRRPISDSASIAHELHEVRVPREQTTRLRTANLLSFLHKFQTRVIADHGTKKPVLVSPFQQTDKEKNRWWITSSIIDDTIRHINFYAYMEREKEKKKRIKHVASLIRISLPIRTRKFSRNLGELVQDSWPVTQPEYRFFRPLRGRASTCASLSRRCEEKNKKEKEKGGGGGGREVQWRSWKTVGKGLLDDERERKRENGRQCENEEGEGGRNVPRRKREEVAESLKAKRAGCAPCITISLGKSWKCCGPLLTSEHWPPSPFSHCAVPLLPLLRNHPRSAFTPSSTEARRDNGELHALPLTLSRRFSLPRPSQRFSYPFSLHQPSPTRVSILDINRFRNVTPLWSRFLENDEINTINMDL